MIYFELKRLRRLGEGRRNTKQRVSMSDSAQKQRFPVYEVQSLGTVIEYTDNLLDSGRAFHEANRPKQITQINWLGHRRLMKSENHFGK